MALTRTAILEGIARGNIAFKPGIRLDQFQPNSVDFTLARRVVGYLPTAKFVLGQPAPKPDFVLDEYPILLEPGKFYLGSTNEWVFCRSNVAHLMGKSSPARMSLCVHKTAGWGDIGFGDAHETWTLEMTVDCLLEIPEPDMPICQIGIFSVVHPATAHMDRYKGKYVGQSGATPAGASTHNAPRLPIGVFTEEELHSLESFFGLPITTGATDE